MKHIILHIGQSKTGTTSLQRVLSDNRPDLLKLGILYPDIHLGGAPLNLLNHNSFAESLCGYSRYPGLTSDQFFNQFKEQADKQSCNTIVLSAESFFGVPQIWRLSPGEDFIQAHTAKLENLKALLGDARCRVILYLRPPEDWFETAVAQIIRYEGLVGSRVYQDDAQLLDLLAPHLDYNALITLWEHILQPDQFTVIPYRAPGAEGGDTVSDFLERMGIPLDKLSRPAPETGKDHASLDRRYVWLKKILNTLPKTKNEERVIIDCLDTLNLELDNRIRYTIDPSLKQAIKDHYAEGNRALARKFSPDRAEFFPSAQQSDPARESRPLGFEEQVAALISFQRRYYSFGTKWKRVRINIAAFLRKRLPIVHGGLGKALRALKTR